MTASNATHRLDLTYGVAVPAALAVLTWGVLLVAVGRLLRFGPLGLHNLLWLAALGAMGWPVVAFAPWRDGAGERLDSWFRERWRRLSLAAVLAGLVPVLRVLDVAALLLTVLVLPTDILASGLYATAAFYRELVGPTVGAGVFWFARWYLVGLWLYGLSSLLATVVPGPRRR